MTANVEAANTYDAIVQTALELFLRDGFDGTSMKAIATGVGITTPGLYWHFASKQELFHVAFTRQLDRFIARVLSEVTSEDPVEALSQLTRAHVRDQLANSEAASAYHQSFGFRGLIQKLPEDVRQDIRSRERRYVDEIRRILDRGREAGVFHFEDLKVTAFAVITLCDFANSWFSPAGEYSAQRIADMHVPFVLGLVGYSDGGGVDGPAPGG